LLGSLLHNINEREFYGPFAVDKFANAAHNGANVFYELVLGGLIPRVWDRYPWHHRKPIYTCLSMACFEVDNLIDQSVRCPKNLWIVVRRRRWAIRPPLRVYCYL
jgi:hypothetical protein